MKHWIKAANKAIGAALSMMEKLPAPRLSVWADENFYMSAESSYVEGAWKAYPPQRFLLDCAGDDRIEQFNIKKAARTGGTKILVAASAYFTIVKRRNQGIWRPTEMDARKFTIGHMDPAIRDVSGFKKVFPAAGKRHEHNTNSYKKYLGCVTHILGGSSSRNFQDLSLDVGIMDEVSKFDQNISDEGSPDKLAKKRLEGATFPKLILNSTPKKKYTCIISAAVEASESIFQCHIPCPHCDTEQVLEFGDKETPYGLKWINNDPQTTAYLCKSCGSLFSQADYLKAWNRCKWKDQHGNWYDDPTGKFYNALNEAIEPHKTIGIDNFWTLYSPQKKWTEIVDDYLKAVKKAKHGDFSDLITFTNVTLGREWEQEADETEADALIKRAEDYPLKTIPFGGLILLAGIDVQKDRFEIVVWAFGQGEEMWIIEYLVIPANPTIQEEWNKLDPILLHQYPHAAGTVLGIEHAGIDTGGHWAHQCYNYVRERQTKQGWSNPDANSTPKLYATKGSSTPNQNISSKPTLQDINIFGRVIRRGIKLYKIGTDTAKDLLHGRLQVERKGPGCIHLSKHLDNAFFDQLTSEVRIIETSKKGDISRWVKRRQGIRNEVLDCTVMTLFCAHKAALHRKTNAQWQQLKNIIQPDQNDIFAINFEKPEPESGTPAPAMPPLVKSISNSKPVTPPVFIPE